MCDNCKETKPTSKESITNPSEILAELKSPSIDSTTDQIFFCEPFIVDTENLEEDPDIQIDKDEFIRGMKESSYFAGFYTGLINVGMSVEDSVALIFNFMNVNHNIEISKVNANASIESSKNVTVAKEKEML